MKYFASCGIASFLLLHTIAAQAQGWVLRGKILTPEAAISNGSVVVDGQKILEVGNDIVPPSTARQISVEGIVLPAFIDLHNHLTWNVFPRWRPARKFSNRYEWQEVPEYDRLLRTPQGRLIREGLGCEANLFAEVRAIIGGAASVVGSFGVPNSPDGNKCIDGLARNLDLRPEFPPYSASATTCEGDASGFPPGSLGVVANEVFPFEIAHGRYTYYQCELKNGRLRSVLIHLAEGSQTDASARREFRMLKAQNMLMDGLIVIHGAALTLPDFQHMREKNVGLIWSPRSNDELYGGTANIPAAMQAGVTIAIAPDWSPTGSAGMLQELNYAASKYSYINPEKLVDMATSIPARLARVNDRIGKLEKGLYADILVIRQRGSSPYQAVVTATPADIRLVMISGRPIYGDYDVLEPLVSASKLVRFTVCGTPKGLDFSDIAHSWNDIHDRLEAALRQYGTSLGTPECD
jgi:hypothetical protein